MLKRANRVGADMGLQPCMCVPVPCRCRSRHSWLLGLWPNRNALFVQHCVGLVVSLFCAQHHQEWRRLGRQVLLIDTLDCGEIQFFLGGREER